MIIITGAAGFIGSNLANYLNKNCKEPIICIDNLKFGSRKNLNDSIYLYEQDFRCLPLKTCYDDVLVHLATFNINYASVHPEETFINNANNTIELFNSFPGKIIYISSASIYGDPVTFPVSESHRIRPENAYAISKLTPELILQERGNFTTLRLSNVYGRNARPELYCGVIGWIIRAAIKHETFKLINHGDDTRDFVYIDDVISAILIAIDKLPINCAVNICTGIETRIKDIMSEISAISGEEIRTIEEKAHKKDNILRRVLDPKRANHLLSWNHIFSLNEGLVEYYIWMKNEYGQER